MKNLTALRFGRLTVIDRSNDSQKRPYWVCRCDCGTTKTVRQDHLISGKIVSCGCYLKEICGQSQRKHGLKNTPEYTAWCGMRQRCEDKNSNTFPRYGGRGISICNRWRESFLAFLEDMGHRPTPKHSIDRIDNSGNYEPGNCRWATKSEQARNRRSSRLIEFEGRKVLLCDLAKETGVPHQTICKRLKRGLKGRDLVSENPPTRRRRPVSGFIGVHFKKEKNYARPWVASASVAGQRFRIGVFATAEAANAARTNWINEHK